MVAVKCSLVLTAGIAVVDYFGDGDSFCFGDAGLFVGISGGWLEEGLDGGQGVGLG